MNTRFYFPPDSWNSFSCPIPSPSASPLSEGHVGRNDQSGSSRALPLSILMRTVMRISRARWFIFFRSVFHYQNGSRSDLGSNPLNSGVWIGLELIVLVAQITAITVTLAISKIDKPVWPLRIWVVGYNIGCFLSFPLLYWRYKHPYVSQSNNFNASDTEQQRSSEESRSSFLMNKSRVFLELFFAIWFVIGNVWVFDSRNGSFNQDPEIHRLCVFLLAWNAVSYSFPFFLFLLLCCCVPLISNTLGYNMNLASTDRGASDEQISSLPNWRFKADASLEARNGEDSECCICLAKYKDKEEVRELPCSHFFHLRCVDQWLKIISCCPLCKQQLDK